MSVLEALNTLFYVEYKIKLPRPELTCLCIGENCKEESKKHPQSTQQTLYKFGFYLHKLEPAHYPWLQFWPDVIDTNLASIFHFKGST